MHLPKKKVSWQSENALATRRKAFNQNRVRRGRRGAGGSGRRGEEQQKKQKKPEGRMPAGRGGGMYRYAAGVEGRGKAVVQEKKLRLRGNKTNPNFLWRTQNNTTNNWGQGCFSHRSLRGRTSRLPHQKETSDKPREREARLTEQKKVRGTHAGRKGKTRSRGGLDGFHG